MYNTLLQAIEQEPKTLENYIEIISFILSLEFKGKRTKMIEDIEALKLCINCHEKFLIELEESLLQISLEAFTWPSKISRYRKNSKMKLKLMKPKFMKVLEERKALLKDRFKDLHERSKLFENYYDLNQAFQICQIAREIVSGLKEVIANGKTFNEQERFLGYEISDFGEFEFSLENFEKFFLLWDFAEKWKFVFFLKLFYLFLFNIREVKIGLVWNSAHWTRLKWRKLYVMDPSFYKIWRGIWKRMRIS